MGLSIIHFLSSLLEGYGQAGEVAGKSWTGQPGDAECNPTPFISLLQTTTASSHQTLMSFRDRLLLPLHMGMGTGPGTCWEYGASQPPSLRGAPGQPRHCGVAV